ncbi:ATP-binding protein of ABC transporter [Bifidobacterium actinocoloniiforme DSM 22766]|uniref:ATP-binding protein of ABC transporter n=1 Tax=Bifidobacterium actinocoloniiforme DSM 22766 TaxID=1437605 RepID=A0A086YYG3_9BIFI|nr:ATP-binding cassette domain-containing protein [Bifidobacterium actinocoloniiforme]AKV55863.1 hypothetical protein AB656_06550 [Bifidobacterium actinocoloniiforme DSM 22766]KFI39313.1 ATP-binding protein of ABC transporter [Bifidobacterium actinocoloniiforme DSM 22766]
MTSSEKPDEGQDAQTVGQEKPEAPQEGTARRAEDTRRTEPAQPIEDFAAIGDEASQEADDGQEDGSEPEFKVVIESEAVEEGDWSSDDEDPLASMDTDMDDTDIPVPSGYPVLELRHVSLSGRGKDSTTYLLDDVDMSFRIRRTHCVQTGSPERLGALMGVISGLLAPSEGTVLFRGTDLRQIEAWDYRGHQLGVIFARDALRTDMSAVENLSYAMEASGRTFLKPKDTQARDLLEEMSFPERLEQRPVRELSRLDYVRAALARAISCEPDVLLTQELMDGLSEDEAADILALLRKTARRHDCAVIVACSGHPSEGPYDRTYTLE